MHSAHLRCAFLLATIYAPIAIAGAQAPRQSRLFVIQVIDSATHEPISGAEVRSLRPPSLHFTPKSGALRIASLSRGDTLAVRRLGYHPIQIAAEAIPELPVVAIGLVATPRILADVTIESRIGAILSEVGFFDRRDRLSGFFLDPSQMLEMHPSRTSDIFERALGAKLSPAGSGGRSVRFSRAQDCEPSVFLDGVLLLNQPSVSRDATPRVRLSRANEAGTDIYTLQDHGIDEIGVRQIAAVEAYENAVQAPPEFNTQGANCGVILFWTWNNVRK
jgi:hypothetical protein